MPPKSVSKVNKFIWTCTRCDKPPSKRDLMLMEQKLHDPSVVADLLERGSLAPNSTIGIGCRKLTLLDYAAKIGSRPLVELLLGRGANPRRGSFGQYSVNSAIEAGDAAMLRMLLEHGAEAGGRCQKSLWQAALKNRLDLVQLLLEHGAKPNRSQGMRAGLRAIHLAALRGNIAMIDALAQHGAQVNPVVRFADEHVPAGIQAGDRPLHIAVRAGKKQAVKRLLELGADTCYANREGQLPADLETDKYKGHLRCATHFVHGSPPRPRM